MAGTVRPCRVPKPEPELAAPLCALPDAPDWLPNEAAKEEWKALGAVLIRSKRLTELGLTPFAHLCAINGRIKQDWAEQTCPATALLSLSQKYMSDFGLTPEAEKKTQVANDKKPQNKFNRFGQRP